MPAAPIKVQYLLKLEVPLLWGQFTASWHLVHGCGDQGMGAHAKCCCLCRGWGLVLVIWLATGLLG